MRPIQRFLFHRCIATGTCLAFWLTSSGVSQALATLPSLTESSKGFHFPKDLTPPAQLGRITDYYDARPESCVLSRESNTATLARDARPKTQDPQLVVLIQDLHAHYEVQRKIQKILEFLEKRLGIGSFIVGVEGASGNVESQKLGALPHPKAKQKIADFLMKEAELTGAEAYAIVNGRAGALWGIEDEESYEAHLQLFRKTYPVRARLAAQLARLEQDLAALKKRHYSRRLREVERLRDRFARGKLGLEEYLGFLVKNGLRNAEHANQFPLLRSYQRAISAEKIAGFERIFAEADALSYRLQADWSESSLQRNLVAISQAVSVLGRLLHQKMTETEVRAYAPVVSEWVNALTALARETPLSLDPADFGRAAQAAIDFYVMALVRNRPLVENTLRLLNHPEPVSKNHAELVEAGKPDHILRRAQDDLKAVVLVAGGFHTAGIAQALKSQEVSYFVITPTVTENPEKYEKLYVERLLGRHLTDEEIVAGVRAALIAAKLREAFPKIARAFSVAYAMKPAGENAPPSDSPKRAMGPKNTVDSESPSGLLRKLGRLLRDPWRRFNPFHPQTAMAAVRETFLARKVKSYDPETESWTGAREEGKVIGKGNYEIGDTLAKTRVHVSGFRRHVVQQTAEFLNHALAKLAEYESSYAVKTVFSDFQKLQPPHHRVAFLEDNDTLIDLALLRHRGAPTEDRVIRFDTDIITQLFDSEEGILEFRNGEIRAKGDYMFRTRQGRQVIRGEELIRGLLVLLAMGQHHEWSHQIETQRRRERILDPVLREKLALQYTADFYEALRAEDRQALLVVLRSDLIDASNNLANFLARVTDPDRAFADEDRVDEKPLARAAVGSLRNLPYIKTLDFTERLKDITAAVQRKDRKASLQYLEDFLHDVLNHVDLPRGRGGIRRWTLPQAWEHREEFFEALPEGSYARFLVESLFRIYSLLPARQQAEFRARPVQQEIERLARILDKRIRWRNKLAAWLIGRDQLDKAYPTEAADRRIFEEGLTEDERRGLILEETRKIDNRKERETVRRFARELHDRGELLYVGVASRGALNQGLLLADANWIHVDEKMEAWVIRLKHDLEKLEAVAIVSGDVPSASELRKMLVAGQRVGLAKYTGALERLDQDLVKYFQGQEEAFHQLDRDAARKLRETYRSRVDRDREAQFQELRRQIDGLRGLLHGERKVLEAVVQQPGLPQREKVPAGWAVLLAHNSDTAAHLQAKINEGVDPFRGKEEPLRDLSARALHRITASSSNAWLSRADWFNIPYTGYIYEVTETAEGDRVLTRVDVELNRLIATLREVMGTDWRENLAHVMDTEHVSLARRLMFMMEHPRRRYQIPDEFRLQKMYDARREEVASVGALIALTWQENAERLTTEWKRRGEREGRYEVLRDFLDNEKRASNLAYQLQRSYGKWGQRNWTKLTQRILSRSRITHKKKRFDHQFRRIQDDAIEYTRRRLPLADLLTTMAPGLSRILYHTIIDSIAMANLVEEFGLQEEVNSKISRYNQGIANAGRRVLKEARLWYLVQERVAKGESETDAILAVAKQRYEKTNPKSIGHEVSRLALLQQYAKGKERDIVDRVIRKNLGVTRGSYTNGDWLEEAIQERWDNDLLQAAAHRVAVENRQNFAELVAPIYERRKRDHRLASDLAAFKQILLQHDDLGRLYRRELAAAVLFEARMRAIEEIDRRRRSGKKFAVTLGDQVDQYLWDHDTRGGLGRMTAMQEVLATPRRVGRRFYRTGLMALMSNPRYNWEPMVLFTHSSSRVNLGPGELDSVRKWWQWFGGINPLSIRAAREYYSLINEGHFLEAESPEEDETIKTIGENSTREMAFANANIIALFIHAIGRGHIDVVRQQIYQRGEDIVPEPGEGYGGYCIPKDDLWADWILALTHDWKLALLGVPAHHRPIVKALVLKLLAMRSSFSSGDAWVLHTAQLMMDHEALRNLEITVGNKKVRFLDLLKIENSIVYLRLDAVTAVLQDVGQPDLIDGARIVKNLAARLGTHSIVVSSEQLVRFMVFYKNWMLLHELFEAAIDKALPDVLLSRFGFRESYTDEQVAKAREIAKGIARERLQRARVVKYTEYKQDTQDPRYSTQTRGAEILMQEWAHHAANLGPEMQVLVHLMFNGFDPEDRSAMGKDARDYLQKQLQIQVDIPRGAKRAQIDSIQQTRRRLKEAFPGFAPVGNITMMTETGLSTDDVLVQHEFHQTLKKNAEEAQAILQAIGMSERDIATNIRNYDTDMEIWTRGIPRDPGLWRHIQQVIGGKLQALAIQVKGLETDPDRGFQKQDAIDFAIAHRRLVNEWVKQPEKLIEVMDIGKDERWDGSLYVIPDGGVGRKRRAFEASDVKLLYAAAAHIRRRQVLGDVVDGTLLKAFGFANQYQPGNKKGWLLPALQDGAGGKDAITADGRGIRVEALGPDLAHVLRKAASLRADGKSYAARDVEKAIAWMLRHYSFGIRYFGIGIETTKAWRDEQEQHDQRAARLLDAVRSGNYQRALAEFTKIQNEAKENKEGEKLDNEIIRLKDFKAERRSPEIKALRDAMTPFQSGLTLGQLDWGTFLAIGGRYTLIGTDRAQLEKIRKEFETQIKAFRREEIRRAKGKRPGIKDPLKDSQIAEMVDFLTHPRYEPPPMEPKRQERRVETSAKGGQQWVEAVAGVYAREAAEKRTVALGRRQASFNKVWERLSDPKTNDVRDIATAYNRAVAELGDSHSPVSEEAFGRYLAYTRKAFELAADQYGSDETMKAQMKKRASDLFSGREIDDLAFRAVLGSYQGSGDIATLADLVIRRAQERKRDHESEGNAFRRLGVEPKMDELAKVAQLIDQTRFLSRINEYALQARPHAEDARRHFQTRLMVDMANAAAEVFNDHRHAYMPHAFARGSSFYDFANATGFMRFFAALGYSEAAPPENQDMAYLWATRHIEWMSRYATWLIHTRTEYADRDRWSKAQVDARLGVDRGPDREPITPIGHSGRDLVERRYRTLSQWREVSFGYRDALQYGEYGFPQVFPELDPTIIQADLGQGVNHILLFPSDRTHKKPLDKVAAAARRHRMEKGKRPANLITTRHGRLERLPINGHPGKMPAFVIDDGLTYISPEEYAQALVVHRGYTRAQAQKEAARVAKLYSGKGIWIAGRFGRGGKPVPVVGVPGPFHGHPFHEDFTLENQKFPAHMASIYVTDTKFNKALYKEMLAHYGEVIQLPREMVLTREMIWQLRRLGWPDYEIRRLVREGSDAGGFRSEPPFEYKGVLPFAREISPWQINKVPTQSGGRGMLEVLLQNMQGELQENLVDAAVDYILDAVKGDDNITQEVVALPTQILVNMAFWRWFQSRQVLDWGQLGVVLRDDVRPQPVSFSTFRIVASRDPKSKKVKMVKRLFMSSLDLITNVGRGGTLQILSPEWIPRDIYDALVGELDRQTEALFEAVQKLAPDYLERYQQTRGRDEIGADFKGDPYEMLWYAMVDFTAEPILETDGQAIDKSAVVQIEFEPKLVKNSDQKGRVWYEREGHRIWAYVRQGDTVKRVRVTGFTIRPVFLEHNVGIGLWDRYYLAELYRELRRLGVDDTVPGFDIAKAIRDKWDQINWDNVGAGAEAIAQHWFDRDEGWLEWNWGGAYFAANGGPSEPSPSPIPSPARGEGDKRKFSSPLTREDIGEGGERLASVASIVKAVAQMIGDLPDAHLGSPESVTPILKYAVLAELARQGGENLNTEHLRSREALREIPSLQKLRETLRNNAQAQSALRTNVLAFLNDLKNRQALAKALRTSGIHIGSGFFTEDYLERITDLVLEALLFEPVHLQELQIVPQKIARGKESRFLAKKRTLAVVTDRAIGSTQNLYPLMNDALRQNAEVNVIGVHSDWLTHDQKVSRAIIRQPKTRRLVEVKFDTPMDYDALFLTELGGTKKTEHERHLQLAEEAKLHGKVVVNDVEVAALADDKALWAESQTDKLDTQIIAQTDSAEDVFVKIQAAIRRAGAPMGESICLIAKPRFGTGAQEIAAADFPPRNASRISPDNDFVRWVNRMKVGGDIVLQPYMNDLALTPKEPGQPGRRGVFRVNVAVINGMPSAVSAYLHLASEEEPLVASAARGGIAADWFSYLNQLGMQRGNGSWKHLAIEPDDLRTLVFQAAEKEALSIAGNKGIALVGIDVSIVERKGSIQPIVYEANARPVGLDAARDAAGIPVVAPPEFWTGLVELIKANRHRENRSPAVHRWRAVASPVAAGAYLLTREQKRWIAGLTVLTMFMMAGPMLMQGGSWISLLNLLQIPLFALAGYALHEAGHRLMEWLLVRPDEKEVGPIKRGLVALMGPAANLFASMGLMIYLAHMGYSLGDIVQDPIWIGLSIVTAVSFIRIGAGNDWEHVQRMTRAIIESGHLCAGPVKDWVALGLLWSVFALALYHLPWLSHWDPASRLIVSLLAPPVSVLAVSSLPFNPAGEGGHSPSGAGAHANRVSPEELARIAQDFRPDVIAADIDRTLNEKGLSNLDDPSYPYNLTNLYLLGTHVRAGRTVIPITGNNRAQARRMIGRPLVEEMFSGDADAEQRLVFVHDSGPGAFHYRQGRLEDHGEQLIYTLEMRRVLTEKLIGSYYDHLGSLADGFPESIVRETIQRMREETLKVLHAKMNEPEWVQASSEQAFKLELHPLSLEGREILTGLYLIDSGSKIEIEMEDAGGEAKQKELIPSFTARIAADLEEVALPSIIPSQSRYVNHGPTYVNYSISHKGIRLKKELELLIEARRAKGITEPLRVLVMGDSSGDREMLQCKVEGAEILPVFVGPGEMPGTIHSEALYARGACICLAAALTPAEREAALSSRFTRDENQDHEREVRKLRQAMPDAIQQKRESSTVGCIAVILATAVLVTAFFYYLNDIETFLDVTLPDFARRILDALFGVITRTHQGLVVAALTAVGVGIVNARHDNKSGGSGNATMRFWEAVLAASLVYLVGPPLTYPLLQLGIAVGLAAGLHLLGHVSVGKLVGLSSIRIQPVWKGLWGSGIEEKPDPEEFAQLTPLGRVQFLAGGAVFNLLTAMILHVLTQDSTGMAPVWMETVIAANVALGTLTAIRETAIPLVRLVARRFMIFVRRSLAATLTMLAVSTIAGWGVPDPPRSNPGWSIHRSQSAEDLARDRWATLQKLEFLVDRVPQAVKVDVQGDPSQYAGSLKDFLVRLLREQGQRSEEGRGDTWLAVQPNRRIEGGAVAEPIRITLEDLEVLNVDHPLIAAVEAVRASGHDVLVREALTSPADPDNRLVLHVDAHFTYPGHYYAAGISRNGERWNPETRESYATAARAATAALKGLNTSFGPRQVLSSANVVIEARLDRSGNVQACGVLEVIPQRSRRPVRILDSDVPAFIMRMVEHELDEDHSQLLDLVESPYTYLELVDRLKAFLSSDDQGDPNRLLRQERAILILGDILWRVKADRACGLDLGSAMRIPWEGGWEALIQDISHDETTRENIRRVLFREPLRFGNDADYEKFINQFLRAADQREREDFWRSSEPLLRGFRERVASGLQLQHPDEKHVVRGPQRVGVSSANASDNWRFAKLLGGWVLNFAVNLFGQTPIRVEVERIDSNALELETIDRLHTAFPKRVRLDAHTMGDEQNGFFTRDPNNPSKLFHRDDPLMLLKYAFIFTGIVNPQREDLQAYRQDPGRILDDVARFTNGGGLRFKLVNQGPARSGFASSSSVSLALLKALLMAAGLEEFAGDRILLGSLALLMENELDFRSGRQDVDGPALPGIKSIFYRPTTGFLEPRDPDHPDTPGPSWKKLDIDEQEFADNLILVDTGIQRPAATDDLSRGLSMRHLAHLSRDPGRIGAILKSYGIHHHIVRAFETRNSPRLGRLFRQYMDLRRTIDPGATQSTWRDPQGQEVLLYLFDRLEEKGLIYGGMFTGAMGGGVAMLVPTEKGKERVWSWRHFLKGHLRKVRRLDAELESIRARYRVQARNGDRTAKPYKDLRVIEYSVNTEGVDYHRETPPPAGPRGGRFSALPRDPVVGIVLAVVALAARVVLRWKERRQVRSILEHRLSDGTSRVNPGIKSIDLTTDGGSDLNELLPPQSSIKSIVSDMRRVLRRKGRSKWAVLGAA